MTVKQVLDQNKEIKNIEMFANSFHIDFTKGVASTFRDDDFEKYYDDEIATYEVATTPQEYEAVTSDPNSDLLDLEIFPILLILLKN